MASTDIVELKKNLSHILVAGSGEGPELTVGNTVLKFKPKVTFGAFTKLQHGLADETADKAQVMLSYIQNLLVSDWAEFEALLDDIDITGISEIIGAISEIYSGFQDKS